MNSMKPNKAWLACILGFAILGGCGKEQPGPGAAPSSGPPAGTSAGTKPASVAGSAAITTADLDKAGKAKKPYRLVLIVKTRNNPFFDPMIKAFVDECRALDATPDVQAPQQEGDKEVQYNY